MKKILTMTAIALAVSACGGGKSGDEAPAAGGLPVVKATDNCVVYWLKDNQGERLMPASLFPDAPQAMIDSLGVQDGVPASVGTFLLLGNDGIVLFDTGNGGEGAGLCAGLDSLGIAPADVDYLYITHFYDEQKSAFVFDGLPGVDGSGCPGYITGNDILDGTDGGWREEFGDTENIPTATIDQIQDLTNGMTINERGDKFYIVDGEPVIVPGYVPYWLVRNHEDRYGNANDMPGQQCQYCCNKTCYNCSLNDQYQAFLSDPNNKTNKIIVRQVFIDMTLWKLMFDRGIVIYDDVLTYANNNFNREIDRVYTDCPNIYVDEHLYKRSVLNRLVTHDFKHNPFEYCQLTCSEADPRIAKFQGKNIYYLESYDKYRSCNLNTGYYDIWDEEFQWRIKNCKPYSTNMIRVPVSDSCNSCTAQYPYYYPFNRSLRNAIILGYNRKPIDWENLEIESERSIENYTLIPIVLSYYKEYISSLQR